MRSMTCLYIDGAVVQAVEASLSRGRLAVHDARTFSREELDGYLAGRRGRRLVACCNPGIFYQHTLHLPPAASAHYRSLVRSEVKRLHPEVEAVSTIHAIVGQTTIDHKVFNMVAAFGFDDSSHCALLESLGRQSKELRRLYPAPYPIFRLLAPHCAGPEGRLFMVPVPGEKLLLVGQDSQLRFVRKMPASLSNVPAGESQTLRMTLDYCAETLGVTATEVLVVGGNASGTAPAGVGARSVTPRALAHLPDDLVGTYLAPLACALHFFHHPADGDILPPEYKSYGAERAFLVRGGLSLTTLALLAGIYAVNDSIAASRLQREIGHLRSQLAGAGNELAEYRKLDGEAVQVQRRLALVQKESPASALAAISTLRTAGCSLKQISAQDEAGAMKVRLSGEVQATGFSEAQQVFEGLIAQLSQLGGFTVVSSNLLMKDRTFDIQARYSAPTRRKG